MATPLSRFARLAPTERALLPRLVALVAAIRIGLWVAGHVRVRQWLHRDWVAGRFSMDLHSLTPDRLAWAVRTASRPVPAATCLTQSLALQFLLTRSGRSSSIRIGVAKPAGRFAAHAWVECGQQQLLGAPSGNTTFVEILSWEDR